MINVFKHVPPLEATFVRAMCPVVAPLPAAQCAGFFRRARAITRGRLVASPLFNRNGVYVSQDYTTWNCLKNDC